MRDFAYHHYAVRFTQWFQFDSMNLHLCSTDSLVSQNVSLLRWIGPLMTTSCYVYWVPVNTMHCISFVFTVYQHTIAIKSFRVIHKRIYKLSTSHLLAAEDCLLSMPGDWSATLFEYLRLFYCLPPISIPLPTYPVRASRVVFYSIRLNNISESGQP